MLPYSVMCGTMFQSLSPSPWQIHSFAAGFINKFNVKYVTSF